MADRINLGYLLVADELHGHLRWVAGESFRLLRQSYHGSPAESVQGSAAELGITPMDDAAKLEERTVNSDELANLIRDAVSKEKIISFNAPGNSMAPFIHSGDKIFVAPVAEASIRTGDVLVFVQPDTGRLLAHRVIRITDGQYYPKGDNVRGEGDGWISFTDVLGRVIRVQRNGNERQLGLGPEKLLISLLSRGKILVPMLNFFRRIKWGFKRLISARG